MDDFEGSYAPQSPDLSGLQQTFDQPDPFSNSYYPPQQQSSFNTSYLQQTTNHDPFQFNQIAAQRNSNSFQSPSQPPDQYQPLQMGRNGKAKARLEDGEFLPDASSTKGSAGRKSKKLAVEEDVCSKPAPGVAEGIEVKTKFPVARIKRIMQADEDVGKVAQVAPTAVSKALELFMISVVTKAAAVARAKSSKRVTAAHLKEAVEKDEQLDFLAEIISKVPDAETSKKEKSEDSEDVVDGKRKKKAPTKKRKKDDDDL